MKLSKLILPLIHLMLLLTACQTTPLPNKSTIQANYGSNHQFKHNSPILDVESDYIVADVKNTLVYKGNVKLKRDPSVKFLADCISLEYNERGITDVVEMKGNVSMITPAALTIKSEKAGSSDFTIYIDFVGNVNVSNKDRHYKADWVRYYFLQGELQLKSNDIPTISRRKTMNPAACEPFPGRKKDE